MSWNIILIGKPENIVTALKAHSDTLSAGSKVEFDAALPHLCGLIEQNFNTTGSQYAMQLQASGHGHDNYRQCTVTLSYLGGQLV